MGKFTQSVKRIVQEVKEDGTQGKSLFYKFITKTFCLCTLLSSDVFLSKGISLYLIF